MRKFVCALLLLCCLGLTYACAADNNEEYRQVDRLEKLIYGQIRAGGMIARLSTAEKDLFGRELPGSIAERQAAITNFLEKGANGQPSLLYKLAVAEWALEQKNNVMLPLMRRVPLLEERLEGAAMTEKPIAMRVEKLLSQVVSEPVTWTPVSLPQGTVLRLALDQTLTPAKTRKDDPITLSVNNDIVINNCLVVSRGSIVHGHVDSVKRPGIFGQPSEIKIAVDMLDAIGPENVPMVIGENAKKASNEFETSYAAAAGTSLVGAIVLGPVGLVSGFLIRGNAKEVPAGSVVFAETAETVSVSSYPIPEGLKTLVKTLPVSRDIIAVPKSSDKKEIDSL